jgi:hypothetical protein
VSFRWELHWVITDALADPHSRAHAGPHACVYGLFNGGFYHVHDHNFIVST